MAKAQSKKKATTTKSMSGASSTIPSPKVRVRMYRQGLGDCFLITFGEGAAARHMLIDCGSLGASDTARGVKVEMSRVIKDIQSTTGGKLTILMATHEHADHLSGFNNSAYQEKPMAVEHVWLAWTEDPEDTDLAPKIRRYEQDLAMAAGVAARALPRPKDGDTDPESAGGLRLATESVMGFNGDIALLGADKFAETIDAAMRFVQKSGKTTTYHRPGNAPIELPEIPGIRFYVLGPPYDKKKLTELGDHHDPDLYGLMAAAQLRASKDSDGSVPAPDLEFCERQMPFDQRYRVTDDNASRAFYPEYYKESECWRRIDHDWLGAAPELALQLDSLTNNTSLAIAIERIADGKVLLFPADAQLGSWRSWHDPEMRWKVKNANGQTVEVTAQDLLKKTVFYKVGHHGSHNATARALGLELMPDGITAFIPVDRDIALKRHPKDSWQMPAYELLKRLLNKANGVVVRSDIGMVTKIPAKTPKTDPEATFIGIASDRSWKDWALHQQAALSSGLIAKSDQDLFWEYHLS